MSRFVSILTLVVIVISVIGVIAAVVILLSDGKSSKDKDNNDKAKEKNSKVKDNKNEKNSESSKKRERVNVYDSRDILDFDDICSIGSGEPKGIIVRKNKTEFIGVLEVYGINYNLLSLEEREMLELNFQKLLNGIDYPFQIHIQSRKLDIENYSKFYTTNLEKIKKSIDIQKNKVNFLKQNNADEKEISKAEIQLNRLVNEYNYGLQIKEWIIERCKYKNMLEKRYFIIVSHKHNQSAFSDKLTFEEMLSNAYFDINNKISSIITSLKRTKLNGKMLSPDEVAELLYCSYNKDDSETYKFKNAVKARYSHYFVKAEPVEVKIAKRRIEKLEKAEKDILNELNRQEKASKGA